MELPNQFLPSAAFHVETSYWVCTVNQITSFNMKCNTWLKLVKLNFQIKFVT